MKPYVSRATAAAASSDVGQDPNPSVRGPPVEHDSGERSQYLHDRPAAVLDRGEPLRRVRVKSRKSARTKAASNVPSPRSTVVRVAVVGSSEGGHDGMTRMFSRSDRTRTVVVSVPPSGAKRNP